MSKIQIFEHSDFRRLFGCINQTGIGSDRLSSVTLALCYKTELDRTVSITFGLIGVRTSEHIKTELRVPVQNRNLFGIQTFTVHYCVSVLEIYLRHPCSCPRPFLVVAGGPLPLPVPSVAVAHTWFLFSPTLRCLQESRTWTCWRRSRTCWVRLHGC